MTRRLLLSGEREDFTILAFVADQLTVRSHHKAPFNVSWTEHVCSVDGIDHFIGLSEGEESGLVFTFIIDVDNEECIITSQQPTLGAPAHCQ